MKADHQFSGSAREPIRIGIVASDPRERAYLNALLHGLPEILASRSCAPSRGSLSHLVKDGLNVVVIASSARPDGEVDFIEELRGDMPGIGFLVIVSAATPRLVMRLLSMGVSAIIERPCEAHIFINAVQSVANGEAFFCTRVTNQLASFFGARRRVLDLLSRREIEVLEELALGLGIERISAGLGISEATVRTHVRNIIEKLGVNSRAEVLAKYLNPIDYEQASAAVKPLGNRVMEPGAVTEREAGTTLE